MDFRYQEMVYKPDYYNFRIDDRTEWLPNGIFNYNVSRMIKDLVHTVPSEWKDLLWRGGGSRAFDQMCISVCDHERSDWGWRSYV